MTNTQPTTPSVEEVIPTQEVESKFKVLVEENVNVNEKTEAEKAQFTLDKLRQDIQSERRELKNLKETKNSIEEVTDNDYHISLQEEHEDLTPLKVKDIIRQELSNARKVSEEEASQNLISGIEDEYEKIAIQNEIKNLNPTLSVDEKFKIAKRNVDFQVQSRLATPQVDAPNGGQSPSGSYNQKQDTENWVDKLKAQKGL